MQITTTQTKDKNIKKTFLRASDDVYLNRDCL